MSFSNMTAGEDRARRYHAADNRSATMAPSDSTVESGPSSNEQADREAFYGDMAPLHLTPLWEVMHTLITPEPVSKAVPCHWRYDEVRPWLMRAGDLISAKEAERRVLILENPGMRGQSRITNTLYAGLQLIRPGEVAPSHRHTQSALRFIMEGAGAYTAVDGERASMSPGDLILTPSWTWHDHGNETDAPTVWLDGLDIPVAQFFDASFVERYPEDSQPVSRPNGDSAARFGRNLKPFGVAATNGASPVFSYPYADYREALEQMRIADEWDRCDGLKMEFINPLAGTPVMQTISAFVQLLPKGFATDHYRSTAGTVYSVIEGEGEAVIGETAYNLKSRDVFVVPSWVPVRFAAGQDMVLFSFSDRGMQQTLGFWREQRGQTPG
jgi:gentisate 1,2-dioxygenase